MNRWLRAAFGFGLTLLLLAGSSCKDLFESSDYFDEPREVQASDGDSSEIKVTWKAPHLRQDDTRKVKNYLVNRSSGAAVSTTETSYSEGAPTIDNLTPVKYTYSITAVYDDGKTYTSTTDTGFGLVTTNLNWKSSSTLVATNSTGSQTRTWYHTWLQAGWTYHFKVSSGQVTVHAEHDIDNGTTTSETFVPNKSGIYNILILVNSGGQTFSNWFD